MRNVFLVAAFCVVALWIAAFFVIPKFYLPPSTANEFGDMFGAVNALFSGLALAAIFATLWLQQMELGKQVDAQERQAKLMKETASIHALSALLASYTQQIGLAQGTLSGEEPGRVDKIRKELEGHVLQQ